MKLFRVVPILIALLGGCSAFMADGIPVETDPAKLAQVAKEFDALKTRWKATTEYEWYRRNAQRSCEVDNAYVLDVIRLCNKVEGPYCWQWRQHYTSDCSQEPLDRNPFTS